MGIIGHICCMYEVYMWYINKHADDSRQLLSLFFSLYVNSNRNVYVYIIIIYFWIVLHVLSRISR